MKMERQRKYRKRQKTEREYLQHQVAELTAHLALLRDADTSQHTSQWEAMSIAQRSYTYQAHLENARLKRALEDQLIVAKALDKLLCKRPQLAAFPTLDVAEWKFQQLPTEPVARAAAFHSLVDAAYADVDAIFLRKRLYDAVDGHRTIQLQPKDDHLALETQSVASMNCSFVASAEKYWNLWAKEGDMAFPCKVHEVLESFGPDTAYCRDTCLTAVAGGVPYLQRLSALKRYTEPHRVVIVLKSILADARYPIAPGLLIGNQTCIYVAEATSDTSCRRRMCLLGEIPMTLPADNPFESVPKVMMADVLLHQLAPLVDAIEQMLTME
ncbi:hypothetical protein SDRG_14730 [Saprolegnia diclina VS20]|uniref:START domain-containing protein n=1 Tax=Saprolegnia diclina (strain VS20) TaxID=1156394 RepID=T0PPN0_SAPDV|nr:hypothetical protein SDRG_14730 [Saprolegnia diclina VS20]EQC27404.1 hypothetical protein SDRG_14730 [Saprolegnia diclina VS20]|eukprot:XP_008619104.1 hypothetical protein SDRG_14730 [Saprolegnia diclina VS20]